MAWPFLDSCSNLSSFSYPNVLDIFFLFDVLAESFTLFITKVSTIFRRIGQITMKKMYFHTHSGNKLSIVQALSVLAHQLAVCSRLLFYSQGESESLISNISKLLIQHHSLVHWNVHPRPSKVSISHTAWKGLHKYSKNLPSFSSTLTNFFINPSFICREWKTILSLGNRKSSITFSITRIQFCSQGSLDIMLVLSSIVS